MMKQHAGQTAHAPQEMAVIVSSVSTQGSCRDEYWFRELSEPTCSLVCGSEGASHLVCGSPDEV